MSDKENLIVASKLKKFIKDEAGMSTASSLADALSEKVREMTRQAIENAKQAKRKTVMDRDVS